MHHICLSSVHVSMCVHPLICEKNMIVQGCDLSAHALTQPGACCNLDYIMIGRREGGRVKVRERESERVREALGWLLAL